MLIGRKPTFTPKDQFYNRCLRHALGIHRIEEITCIASPVEGGGSQALLMMRAINFAREFGLTYVHTPFVEIAHADRPMREWAAAWESLCNLGAGELTTGGDSNRPINFALSFYELCDLFGVTDLGRVLRVPTEPSRTKYYLNKSPRKTSELTVALHVRRGDARPDDPTSFTDNQAVLRTMLALRTILRSCKIKYTIRLFSQGSPSDFGPLCLPDIELCLNADVFWTLDQLIEADVLVMAKGCFSYYAGLISDGIKIAGAEDAWCPLPSGDNWLRCEADGSFDRAAFERQLLSLIRFKRANAARIGGGDGA
jgi:hypothetical protein